MFYVEARQQVFNGNPSTRAKLGAGLVPHRNEVSGAGNLRIIPLGGLGEVGRNMMLLEYEKAILIIDMGFRMPEEDMPGVDYIVPNTSYLRGKEKNIVGVVFTHGHYDHIAAVQYLAAKYKCQIIGSPYTIQVLRSILKDEEVKIPNKFTVLDLDDTLKISENISIELISMSHSTLQCAMVAVHTPDGIILYANDFKFDNTPVLGEKPNYKRLKELGDNNSVLLLIVECVNGLVEGKTPSERVARELLKDVLLNTDSKGKAIFVTSFASNIARIKSAIEFGKKLERKIVILGRSMYKFILSAEALDLVKFSKEAEIVGFGKQRIRKLKEINSNREKYLVICTGSQGEPNSVLDKIVNKQLPFSFQDGDIIIFSCRTIPVPMNIANRDNLENMLKVHKVRIFKDIHSSGHGAKEDIREFISMVKPKIIIPSQGDLNMETSVAKLCEDLGYSIGANVHLLTDGKRLKI